MIKRFGNRVVNYGTKVFQNGQDFVIRSTAATFPAAVDINNVAKFMLEFSGPAKIIIDYGSGTIITYDATFISTGLYRFRMIHVGANAVFTAAGYDTPAYVYPDSLISPRMVTVSINRALLTSCNITTMVFDNQDFIFGFGRYPNLTSFQVTQIGNSGRQAGAILNVDWSDTSALSSLRSLYINSFFAQSSINYGKIPLFFFSMPIKELSIGDQGMAAITFSESNLDKIYQLAPTLTYLTLQNISLTDNNFGNGALPGNFSQLTKLAILRILSVSFTRVPDVVNTITSLTALTFAFSSTATDYGDLSALTSLTYLSVEANANFTTSIPSYFSGLTKLKIFDLRSCFRTQARIDAAISNLYTFIVANAAITGAATLAFRGMTVMIGIFAVGDGTAIPSGTYQQPAGYVAGSSNGSPASSLEKVWVLVNQYLHTWTYRTN